MSTQLIEYPPIDFEQIRIINYNETLKNICPEIFKLLDNSTEYYSQPNRDVKPVKPHRDEKDVILKLMDEINEAKNNKTYTLPNGKKILTDTEMKNYLKKIKKSKTLLAKN